MLKYLSIRAFHQSVSLIVFHLGALFDVCLKIDKSYSFRINSIGISRDHYKVIDAWWYFASFRIRMLSIPPPSSSLADRPGFTLNKQCTTPSNTGLGQLDYCSLKGIAIEWSAWNADMTSAISAILKHPWSSPFSKGMERRASKEDGKQTQHVSARQHK